MQGIVDSDFATVTYTEAVALLEKHKDEFQFPIYWGADLQTEHERYLTEKSIPVRYMISLSNPRP